MSKEAAAVVDAVFAELWELRGGRDPNLNEGLEHAQVRFRHALRRLQAAYPGLFCSWSQQSSAQVFSWTLLLAARGHPIPAAEAAARRVGYDMQRAVAEEKARLEACAVECAAAHSSDQAAGEDGVVV